MFKSIIRLCGAICLLLIIFSGTVIAGPLSVYSENSDSLNLRAIVEHTEPCVETEGASAIEEDKASLYGELISLSSEKEVDVFFQYRKKGSSWSKTSEQSVEEPTEFSVTLTGLAEGTTYAFRAGVGWNEEESFGDSLEFTTDEDPSSPRSPAPSPPPETTVSFEGWAYPGETVTLMKDVSVAATTVTGADATFSTTLTDLTEGNYVFSLYSEDSRGLRSASETFSMSVSEGKIIEKTGIFIAPTLDLDKMEVERGGDIALFGQSAKGAEITIEISGSSDFFIETVANEGGIYLEYFDTAILDYGEYHAKAKATLEEVEEVSKFGRTIPFEVGTRTVYKDPNVLCPPNYPTGDLNYDCRVNLVDFSIATYWYKEPLSPEMEEIECEQLNCDGVIDLVDFSIMAYHWTG